MKAITARVRPGPERLEELGDHSFIHYPPTEIEVQFWLEPREVGEIRARVGGYPSALLELFGRANAGLRFTATGPDPCLIVTHKIDGNAFGTNDQRLIIRAAINQIKAVLAKL